MTVKLNMSFVLSLGHMITIVFDNDKVRMEDWTPDQIQAFVFI